MYSALKILSNVLTLDSIGSWGQIEEQFEGEEVMAFAWFYDEIKFYVPIYGVWNWDGRVIDELVKIRVFNNNKELYAWRKNGSLIGRLRADNIGKVEIEYVEAEQLLKGVSNTYFSNGENSIVIDSSKTYSSLKKSDLKSEDQRPMLITRNYIGYNALGQAGYIDSRIANITLK